ncbi:MAG: DUF58 domain-containing protein [Phycisphaerae bacterium]|nr:DUF58 domain-containing protein [Phycisphaerae bacterium]
MTVRRRYHFGLPGMLYILVTLLIAIGASNSQNNLLFLAFAIAIGAGVASGILSGAMMMGARAERMLPPTATAGAPLTIRYMLHNRNRFLPIFAVSITEQPGRRGRRHAASAWTRFMPEPRAALMHLAPRETIEIPVTVIPTRRGAAAFYGLTLTTSFPFGLIRKSITFESRATLVIAPRSERLRRDATSNLLARAESGLASSPALGRGDEFYGVRNYVPGDSPRLISWRATARVGSLVVREQTAPTAGSLWIMLNLNAPPTAEGADVEHDPLERAIVLCASLIDAAIAAGVEIGFASPEAELLIAPSSAPRQRQAIMTALARIDPTAASPRRTDPTPQLQSLAHRAACIVVHAGGIDPSFGPSGAKHLDASDLARLVVARPTQRPINAEQRP